MRGEGHVHHIRRWPWRRCRSGKASTDGNRATLDQSESQGVVRAVYVGREVDGVDGVVGAVVEGKSCYMYH